MNDSIRRNGNGNSSDPINRGNINGRTENEGRQGPPNQRMSQGERSFNREMGQDNPSRQDGNRQMEGGMQ